MEVLIITTEENCRTARMLERRGIPYKLVACECQRAQFNEARTIFYKCQGEHGSNIARRAALEIEGDFVVMDDDYTCIVHGGYRDLKASKSINYKTAEEINEVIEATRNLEKIGGEKVIVGGYSAGALADSKRRIKPNIMQVYVSQRLKIFFRNESRLYRLNDDVCACMIANRMGYLTIGLWGILRVAQQEEHADNTNDYDIKSWAKSYFPILYCPMAAKVGIVQPHRRPDGTYRPMRYHHVVSWAKIRPIVVERRTE